MFEFFVKVLFFINLTWNLIIENIILNISEKMRDNDYIWFILKYNNNFNNQEGLMPCNFTSDNIILCSDET